MFDHGYGSPHLYTQAAYNVYCVDLVRSRLTVVEGRCPLPGNPGDPGGPGGPLAGRGMLAGSPGRPGGPMTVLPGSPGGP